MKGVSHRNKTYVFFRRITYHEMVYSIEKPVPGGSVLLAATLCGRLGQALRSDTYVDLGSGALARVLVEVGG